MDVDHRDPQTKGALVSHMLGVLQIAESSTK